MQKRHKRKATLITTNLGFSEWGAFLHNTQLTGALIDRRYCPWGRNRTR